MFGSPSEGNSSIMESAPTDNANSISSASNNSNSTSKIVIVRVGPSLGTVETISQPEMTETQEISADVTAETTPSAPPPLPPNRGYMFSSATNLLQSPGFDG